MVLTELVLLCACTFHHFKTAHQPSLRSDCNLFGIHSHVIKQALERRWNVVIYQADEKKRSSLVSVVNKSWYHDTHPEETIGNVWDTDYVFFGAVTKKQHTINIICMKSVFIQSWTISKKYLRSANLPIAIYHNDSHENVMIFTKKVS